MSATPSEQFMPLRSLMYFFTFETTIRMSRSTTSASFTPSTAAALACEASPTTRRTGALPGEAPPPPPAGDDTDTGAGAGAADARGRGGEALDESGAIG